MRRSFDARFVDDVMSRLSAIAEDAVPRWGRMDKQDLVGHLTGVLKYSLGEKAFDIPFQIAPRRRKIAKWLVLTAGVPIPRDVRFRDRHGLAVPLPKVPATAADLQEALERMARAGEGDVPSPLPHPYFGELTLSEWKRFHVIHIGHHLKQFGSRL